MRQALLCVRGEQHTCANLREENLGAVAVLSDLGATTPGLRSLLIVGYVSLPPEKGVPRNSLGQSTLTHLRLSSIFLNVS